MAVGQRVSEGRTVTLNASGAGAAQLAPGVIGWKVSRITTTGTSAVPPSLTIRRGSATGSVVDTTRFGNMDTSETSLDVYPGESLWGVYAGGSAGATMVLYIEGETL